MATEEQEEAFVMIGELYVTNRRLIETLKQRDEEISDLKVIVERLERADRENVQLD